MNKKILMGIISLIGLVARSQTPYVVPNQDYKVFFSQQDIAANAPSAIDANNSVFSTGYMGTAGTAPANLVVLKYDSLGVLQYSVTYDNGGMDNGKAIKVTPAGVALVAGLSQDAGTGYDYIILKIGSTGTVLWTQRFDGAGGIDEATDICFDSNGEVYVTGKSYNGTDYDIVTLKLDGITGSIIWQHSFNGTSNLDDIGTGLAISANGQYLYVIGNSTDATNGTDIVSYALTTGTGTYFWGPTITNGTANSNDKCYSVIMHGNDIALCGEIFNSGTGLDYLVQKVDGSTGGLLWQKEYDISNNTNRATSLVRDSTGNIAVVGTVLNGSLYEYHTVLYDPSGTQYAVNVEATSLNSLIGYPKIVCDTIAHHWYVAGEKQRVTRDFLVYQIAPSGNTAWKEVIDGQSGTDGAPGLSVNGVGVVYAVGMSMNAFSYFDFMTVKINQTPVYMPVNYNFVTDTFSFSHLYYPNSGEILDTAGNPANDVLYYTKFAYPNQYILKDRISFCEFHKDTAQTNPKDSLSRVDMVFMGANPLAQAYPLAFQETSYLNYFMGHTGPSGKTHVKGAASVFVPNFYPYIDLHITSNGAGAKYFFVVKPGAHPASIRLKFEGADQTSLDPSSNELNIKSALGEWSFAKPKIYDVSLNLVTMSLATTTVTGANGWTSLGGNVYGINPGSYSGTWPLVIQIDQGNPPAVSTSSLNCKWSTYNGGGNDDVIFNIKRTAGDSLLLVGGTTSNNYPNVFGVSVFQNVNGGSTDGFLDFFKPNGQRAWSTYVGADNDQNLIDADFSPNGHIYAVGYALTGSMTTNPKMGATNNNVPFGYGDAYIFELEKDGFTSPWLTYYGGTGTDRPTACEFSPAGDFHIIGYTTSKDIPVVGSTPQYTANNNDVGGGRTDGFIVRYDRNTFTVNWATFLGGVNGGPGIQGITDGLFDLDFNALNDMYVVGRTYASDFPIASWMSSTTFSFNNFVDGTITMFNNGELLWSTCMGKTGLDYCNAVKTTTNGGIYVASSFDPLGPYSSWLVNSGNWYYQTSPSTLLFSEFNGTQQLVHNTTVAGILGAWAYDIEVDASGRVYICGSILNPNLPNPVSQPVNAYVETYKGDRDYFLYCLTAGSPSLTWATDIGGPDLDGYEVHMVIGNQNSLFLAGTSRSSSQFPLFDDNGVPYFDPTLTGTSDGTITRFDLGPVNGVGIKETNLAEGVSVYPNPTQSGLNIRLKSYLGEISYFYVYNLMGQLVKTGIIDSGLTTIYVSDLSPGVYLLNIKGINTESSAKFIKHD